MSSGQKKHRAKLSVVRRRYEFYIGFISWVCRDLHTDAK